MNQGYDTGILTMKTNRNYDLPNNSPSKSNKTWVTFLNPFLADAQARFMVTLFVLTQFQYLNGFTPS